MILFTVGCLAIWSHLFSANKEGGRQRGGGWEECFSKQGVTTLAAHPLFAPEINFRQIITLNFLRLTSHQPRQKSHILFCIQTSAQLVPPCLQVINLICKFEKKLSRQSPFPPWPNWWIGLKLSGIEEIASLQAWGREPRSWQHRKLYKPESWTLVGLSPTCNMSCILRGRKNRTNLSYFCFWSSIVYWFCFPIYIILGSLLAWVVLLQVAPHGWSPLDLC